MTQKGKILKEFNEAFATSDINFILDNVTDDISWIAVGDFSVKGKEEFSKALEKMKSEKAYQIKINNIITHGDSAAVDGTMKMPAGDKTYAFCDIYKFSGFKNPKVKELTSYVIEVN
ncbi:nuclear transport factor 2 family protein [Gracilimonas sp.]|uniref:nuclear transport factor 2 family protein n=1 Tax=Gracilimonas sp. TaxID=1974203 RepID=UPI003BAB8F66